MQAGTRAAPVGEYGVAQVHTDRRTHAYGVQIIQRSPDSGESNQKASTCSIHVCLLIRYIHTQAAHARQHTHQTKKEKKAPVVLCSVSNTCTTCNHPHINRNHFLSYQCHIVPFFHSKLLPTYNQLPSKSNETKNEQDNFRQRHVASTAPAQRVAAAQPS